MVEYDKTTYKKGDMSMKSRCCLVMFILASLLITAGTANSWPIKSDEKVQKAKNVLAMYVKEIAEKDNYFDPSFINKYVDGLMNSINQNNGQGVIIAHDARRWCKVTLTLDNDEKIKKVDVTQYQKNFNETFKKYKIDQSKWPEFVKQFNISGYAVTTTADGNLKYYYDFAKDSFKVAVTRQTVESKQPQPLSNEDKTKPITGADPSSFASKIYMLHLNYDEYHNRLIERCASQFPETAQSLRTVITQWSKRNKPAIKEILSLERKNFLEQGMFESKIKYDENEAQISKQLTQFMTNGIATMPDSQLKEACSGKYAEMLADPNMDYAAFLEQLKAGLKQEQDSMAKHKDERKLISLLNEKSSKNYIDAVAWCPDGRWIATTGPNYEDKVTVWDSATLSIRQQLDQGDNGHGGDNLTFSPDSKYLASGLSTVNVWNVVDGTLLTTLIAPHITPGIPQDVEIVSLRFSPDGKMLVVVYGGDKEIVIAYRTDNWEIAWSYEPQKRTHFSLTPLVFTPDDKYLILGVGEVVGSNIDDIRWMAKILLLDAATGKFLRSIDNIHTANPKALAISPDGKFVATGTNTGDIDSRWYPKGNKDPIRIWNLETGKLVKELPVTCAASSLAFSRDGKYLYGAKCDSANLTLAVWVMESGEMVQEVKNNPGPLSLSVSPDGKKLAAACQYKLSIYEIKTDNP